MLFIKAIALLVVNEQECCLSPLSAFPVVSGKGVYAVCVLDSNTIVNCGIFNELKWAY